jgi:guanine nucleotide-binding protein G(i) subunit alpha
LGRLADLNPPGNNASEESAIVKQMKISHGGYTCEELADFRQIIWKSLLENSRNIVQALRTFDLEPVNHANRVRRFFYTFSVPH